MVTEDIKNEIIAFLMLKNSDTDKALELWGKYGKNKALDRVFYRNARGNLDKIKYELSKVAGISMLNFLNGVFDASEKIEPVKEEIPAIILRIKDEMLGLFAMLSNWQKELTDLGDKTDEETQQEAAEIGAMLDSANARYELLFAVEAAYFKDKTLPDEAELYPVVDDTDPFGLKNMEGSELMGRKKNLESSLSKDRNMLLYQAKKKLEQENPLPAGEERNKIEARIANKSACLEAINALLNVGKTE